MGKGAGEQQQWDLAIPINTVEGQDEVFHVKLMESMQAALEKHGLVVGQEMVPFPVLNVTTTDKMFELTAESMGLKKAIRDDGANREGGGGKNYMAPFEVSYEKHYIANDSEEFWLPCERLQILYHILDNILCPHDIVTRVNAVVKEEEGWFGGEGEEAEEKEGSVQKKIFLLSFLKEKGLLDSCLNYQDKVRRKRIFDHLTKSFLFADFADELRAYYGEEVAFYFCWLQHFMKWLIIPSVLGGLYYVLRFEETLTTESEFVPMYTLVVMVWSFAYLKSWQRRASALSLSWGTFCLPEWTRTERLAFKGEDRISFVTGRHDKFYNPTRRIKHYIFSALVTLLMLCFAAFVMFVSFNLQGYIHDHESYIYFPFLSQFAEPGALLDPESWMGLVPVVLHATLIMYINTAYSSVATWLTGRENHETEEDYIQALILKRFMFEATDCYLPLFYLAFWQFDMERLHEELVALYTADQIRRVLTEAVIPYFMGKLNDVKLAKDEKTGSYRIVSDIGGFLEEEKEKDEYVIFDDYLEIVITYGYIVLFAATFPFAGLISFCCNMIEIRSDAFKLAFVSRRPKPVRSTGIGIWYILLNFITFLAIATNCIIFGLVSDQMYVWFPSLFVDTGDDILLRTGSGRYAVGIVFGLEHVILILCLFIRFMISSTPAWVKNHLARAEYERALGLKKLHKIAVDNAKEEGLIREVPQ